MTATAPPRLTVGQVSHYHREGYVIFADQVFAPAEFQALRTFFDGILEELPADTRPEAMDVPHYLYPELYRWLLADAVLDLVQPIIGPDIALFSSHFICKPTGNGKRVPWHEDSAYWRAIIEPMSVCTVWLAIDPSTRANGCMKVIPRTHATGRKGFSDYEDVDAGRNVFSTEILPAQRREQDAVAIELRPGECSLHDARIMHGSDANTSAIRRCGLTMRFMPTTSRFNHEKFGDVLKIFLARGKDHAGNVFGDPTRAYPEIARYRATKVRNSH